MKTIIPTEEVQYSNLSVSLKNKTITLDVRTRKLNGKRWRKPQTITAKMTYELYGWLTDKRINLNNQKVTGFQKYLDNRGIEFTPGILSQMVFESDNLSEIYSENPFKLLCYDDGAYSITLVHIKSKVKNPQGQWVHQQYKYYSKHCFRRLVFLQKN